MVEEEEEGGWKRWGGMRMVALSGVGLVGISRRFAIIGNSREGRIAWSLLYHGPEKLDNRINELQDPSL